MLPEVGGKIWRILSKNSGQDLLWKNPRIRPQRYAIDANFDNYWCGGWDEAFPTCDPCEFEGENYPNLGELRSLDWNVDDVGQTGTEVRLSALAPISPIRAEKCIRLSGKSVIVESAIENIGCRPIPFLWGSHPAFHIFQGSRLHVPGAVGIVQFSPCAQLGSPGQSYSWPALETPDRTVDMSQMQSADAGTFCGHYVTQLTAGWYALEHPGQSDGLIVTFPADVCRCLWLWLCFGGWRGHHVAVVEPWTNYPVNLAEAVAQGRHQVVAPGATFKVRIAAHVWSPSIPLEDALQSIEERQGVGHSSRGRSSPTPLAE